MAAVFGVDQSTRPPPSAAALVKAGVKFCNHYVADRWTSPVNLDDPATWPTKCLRPVEVAAYRAAGIDMFTNWETSADAMRAGYDRGQSAAVNAAHMARLCGAPADMVVFFSADWPATFDDYTSGIKPFLQGAHSKLGRNAAGKKRSALYGSVFVVQWAFEDGLIDYGWQTAAWSGSPPIWYPKAQLRQYPDAPDRYKVTIDGVSCDIDHALTADFGQWGATDGGMSMAEAQDILDAVDQLRKDLTVVGTTGLQETTAKLYGHAKGAHTDTAKILTALEQAQDPAVLAKLLAGALEITGISTDPAGVVTVTFGPKAPTA